MQAEEEAERKVARSSSKTRSESLSVKRDPARELAAHSDALRDMSAETRLNVGAADATLGNSYGRFNDLWDRHLVALDKIASLQAELAAEKNKDRSTEELKAKLKKQKAKIKQKGLTQRAGLNQLSPLINALAPRVPAWISTYLPIGFDAANTEGNTPRKAMARLFRSMFVESDPLYNEGGSVALALIKSLAAAGGEDDWMMIEQFLVGVIAAASAPESQELATH